MVVRDDGGSRGRDRRDHHPELPAPGFRGRGLSGGGLSRLGSPKATGKLPTRRRSDAVHRCASIEFRGSSRADYGLEPKTVEQDPIN